MNSLQESQMMNRRDRENRKEELKEWGERNVQISDEYETMKYRLEQLTNQNET